jgi:hypothetical protein
MRRDGATAAHPAPGERHRHDERRRRRHPLDRISELGERCCATCSGVAGRDVEPLERLAILACLLRS